MYYGVGYPNLHLSFIFCRFILTDLVRFILSDFFGFIIPEITGTKLLVTHLSRKPSKTTPSLWAWQKASKQLTGYTKVKGLERDKIKQMILQYIQNAGTDGAKRDAIMEYLEGTLPSRNTKEQNTLLVRHILTEMKESEIIIARGKL